MPSRRKKPEVTPRSRPTPTERRKQILTATRSLFRTRGFQKTTPEAIAELVGIKVTTVNKYYPTKSDLFAALYDEFHAAVFSHSGMAPGADTLQFWLTLPARFDKVAKTYRDVVGLALNGLAEASDPDLTHAIGAGLSRTVDELVGLIRAGQAAGMVRRGVDPTRAGWEWVRWLFGGLLLKPTDAEPIASDDDLPPQPADCLLHGLLKMDV